MTFNFQLYFFCFIAYELSRKYFCKHYTIHRNRSLGKLHLFQYEITGRLDFSEECKDEFTRRCLRLESEMNAKWEVFQNRCNSAASILQSPLFPINFIYTSKNKYTISSSLWFCLPLWKRSYNRHRTQQKINHAKSKITVPIPT